MYWIVCALVFFHSERFRSTGAAIIIEIWIIIVIIYVVRSSRWWYAPIKLVCDLPINTEKKKMFFPYSEEDSCNIQHKSSERRERVTEF